MSNPVTYWVQTPEIEALCNKFGYNLEGLSTSEKKALRAVLGMWSMMAYRVQDYSIDGSWQYTEKGWELSQIVDYPMCTPDVQVALGMLDGIHPDYADGLIVAITGQLYHQ